MLRALLLAVAACLVAPVLGGNSRITVHWNQAGTCAKTCAVPDMFIKNIEPETRRYKQTYTCDELVAFFGRNCSFFEWHFDGCDCGGCGCEDPAPIIGCDASSNPTKKGDGYCDEALNTEACDYDGGDCCDSTCSGWACGLTGWSCADPAATELSVSSLAAIDMEECAAALVATRPSAAWAQNEGRLDQIGDGKCQNEIFSTEIGLNSEACGWDGGDCCQETCVDSLVSPTGKCANSTDSAWKCTDPDYAFAGVTSAPTPTPCFNTEGQATDVYGDWCTGGPYGGYENSPDWCGNYDDGDFSSKLMCCACGGGTATSMPTASPAPTPVPTEYEECHDTDFGAMGSLLWSDGETYQLPCSWWTSATVCELYNADDSDWTQSEMCCVCGGGSSTTMPTVTPVPSPKPSHSFEPTAFCVDTAGWGTDADADGCEFYDTSPSGCGGYDDSDFSSNEMCCICGGGGVTPAPTVAREECPSTCFGYTCDYWSNMCIEMESSYGCDCYGCDCPTDPSGSPTAHPTLTLAPTRTCVDTDSGAADSYGNSCSDYQSNPGWCDLYDDFDFSSEKLCCVCGGGDDGTTPAPSPGTSAPTHCGELDEGVGDSYGDGCSAYYGHPTWCGAYDDSDFSANDLCCYCGGGEIATTHAPTVPCVDMEGDASDIYGGGCSVYSANGGYCGNYDDSDFSSTDMCCGCGGGERTAPPSVSPVPTANCFDTDFGVMGSLLWSDGITYQLPCSWWITMTQCDTYNADDSDWTQSEMCCACGGGSTTAAPSVSPVPTPVPSEQPLWCEDLDNGALDPYGGSCADPYDDNVGYCGQYDDSDFSSLDMCCVCGGGRNVFVCSDTAGSAVDKAGLDCTTYDEHPEICGQYDDADFSSEVMCCGCQGGAETTPGPTVSPAPTPAPADGSCFDLEFDVDQAKLGAGELGNTYSSNNEYYGIMDGFCAFFEANPWKCVDSMPFTGGVRYNPKQICCICEGGASGGNCPAACSDMPGTTCDAFPEMTRTFREAAGCPDCGGCQNGCGNNDKVGNGLCEQAALGFPLSSDLNSDECAFDGGDCCPATCIDHAFFVPVGARIERVDSCGVYGWDCRDPNAAEHPNVCEDTDGLAVDSNGDGCAIYEFEPFRCSDSYYSDDDFNGRTMCCACGGGNMIEEAPDHEGTTQTFVFAAYVQRHRGPQRFYLNTTRVDLNRLYAASYGCPISDVTTSDALTDLAQSVDMDMVDGSVGAQIDTLFNPRAMARGAYAGRVALNPSFIGNIDRSYECTQYLQYTDKDGYANRASTGVLASVLDDFAGIKDQDVYAKDFGEEEISASMIQVRGWPSMVDLSYAAPYNAFKLGRKIELLLVPAVGPWQETFDSFGYIFFIRVLPFLVGLAVAVSALTGLKAKRNKDVSRGLKGKQKKFFFWLFGHPTHHVMVFEGIAGVWVGFMHLLCGHGPGSDWLPDAMRTWLLQTRASGMGLYTTLVMVRGAK